MAGKFDLMNVDLPAELKKLNTEELKELAQEIRTFLIDNVSKTGGHIASNLGVVEIAIALHYVFDSPKDKFIWDVGHQSYVHKILTGRARYFDNLRKLDGISGFPKREESEHDIFDTGHSSNSISLAAGMAISRDLKGEDYNVVAIIGDGALTGGMAYEALNNLGTKKNKAIIVLNDNGMSISKNTGGMSQHLTELRISSRYIKAKRGIKKTIESIPAVGNSLSQAMTHIKNSLKYVLVDGIIFEEMGFTYIGPFDGHNIDSLLEAFETAERCQTPVIVHVITEKGKGYKYAEEKPDMFHGIVPFDPNTGKPLNKSGKPDYSRIFGNKLTNLALQNDNICVVCAAMISGTGLKIFSETFPERTFDAGIAEQHAVTFAAGLARGGMRPFVAIYSTFLQRAYDQIIEDVCMQQVPVTLAIDRAGIVGADGETHHGIFDISYLMHMPNLTILSPASAQELEEMMEYALTLEGPCAIRYPRGEAFNRTDDDHLPANRSYVFKESSELEIWASGKMYNIAKDAAAMLESSGFHVGVVNAKILKPLDITTLAESCARTGIIVTLEDNVTVGGFGEQVARFAEEKYPDTQVHVLGWPDEFIEHGSTEELFARYRMDAAGITERIRELLER